MEDLTGKQLSAYQIVAALGEGGMAAVYKAYQPAMDRYVALKILPRHFASDPEFIDRFKQEARLLAKLQHPHILPVFDFGEADGYTYIVMPFVASGTLTDLMHSQPLPFDQVRRVVSQVGDALDYAHASGLIHRDVKPSNILIDERGNCLLTDFGLAKIIESSAHLTASGAIMGTPAYMSPEQGLGEKLDARSDIYSLGVILYEMTTGRVPYSAETPMAVVVKHIYDPLPPPHSLNPNLPESIESVILKALAKNPQDRFTTAGEMVQALQAALVRPTPSMPRVERLAATEPPASSIQATPPWRTLGQPVALTAVGWVIAVVSGLILRSVHPILGAVVAGAMGGLGIGISWKRVEPSVSSRQILMLIVIWTTAIVLFLAMGPLFIIPAALAGWLTGLILRQVQPKLNRKKIAIIALGWTISWFLGGILFIIATSSLGKALSALMVILSILLVGTIGGTIMFRQYKGS